MTKKRVVPQQSDELTLTSKQSLQPSEAVIGKEMYLTALNSKVELDEHLSGAFLDELWDQPLAAIQYAFGEWRRTSPYMPAISDIRALIQRWHGERYEKYRAYKPIPPEERAAIDEWKKGEDYANFRKQLQELDKKLGFPK
jgi:hypothetical protein